MTPSEDPGWSPALRGLPRALVPFVDFRERTRSLGLIGLRTTHLSMVASLPLLVLAFSFIGTIQRRQLRPAWGWLALGAITAIAIFEIWSTGRRMDMAPPDGRVAALRYRALYFIRVGMVMTRAFAGVTLFFVGAQRWAYLIGVIISAVLLWVIAPSRKNLSRLTERYRGQGRDIDMTRALLSLDPPQDGAE